MTDGTRDEKYICTKPISLGSESKDFVRMLIPNEETVSDGQGVESSEAMISSKEVGRALGEVLINPSTKAVKVFNAKELIIESTQGGSKNLPVALNHYIEFFNLTPHRKYNVRVSLVDKNIVRVIFTSDKERMVYQLDNFEYIPARKDRKIFPAHRINESKELIKLALNQALLRPSKKQ